MKLWTALFLLFSLVCGVLSATPDKFARYQSLSRSGPVDLDSAAYEDLTSTPRDYYAVVILTATDSRFGCLLCRDFEPEWDLIARSWNKGSKQDDLKVVFGTLDFDNGKAVFQKVCRSKVES
jgi:oligosaccharyltransferase complex subunit gamma